MNAVAATASSLPSLVRRAASQLASATSAAEVLEARDMAGVAYTAAKSAARLAKAKGAHDELVAKAHHAQADALEIMTLAARRLADEYDAAQERGEVKRVGNPNYSNAEELPGGADIGLSAREVHEARQIRDAEEAQPGIVRETLDAALEAGEEPTKAAVRRAVSKRRPLPVDMSPAGKQLANLRKAWREACPAVRQHFLTEITETTQAHHSTVLGI
jgi:hypothetical protein